MKRPIPHPDPLCFPIPPARIDRTLKAAPIVPAVAANYLAEIQRWRESVLAALATHDPSIARIENLTQRARARLALLLATRWDARTRAGAALYGSPLVPFPAQRPAPLVSHPMKAVMDVLEWRAAVLVYLTEVWDVLGKPELDMGECAAIGGFLRPARLEGRCVYCLTEFDFHKLDPEDHACVLLSHVHAA